MTTNEVINTKQPDDVIKFLRELEVRYGISHEKIEETWNEIMRDPNFEFNSLTDWNVRSRQVGNLVKVYVFLFSHLDPELKELYNSSTSLTGSDIHQTPFLFHIFYRKVF
jgi:hypothetical protein